MSLQPLRLSCVLLAFAAGLAAPVSAAEPPAVVVVRDPVTGEMRAPTPAELRALRPTPVPGTAQGGPGAPKPVVRPDGTRAITLGDAGMVYSVVTRGADGKLKEHCVTGEDAATRTLATPAQPPQEHRHEQR